MWFLYGSSEADLPRIWAIASLGVRLPLTGFFLWLAWRSLSGDAQLTADFERWGYSAGFLRLIGVAQGLGGIALLFPQTCFLGGALLIAVLAGALYTHARFDPVLSLVSPAAFALAIVLAVGVHRPSLPF